MTVVDHPFPQISEVAKTGGLLGAFVLHNLIYPLSLNGAAGPALFYLLYAGMFVVATWLLASELRWRLAATVTGIAVLIAGLSNSYFPSSGAALAVYLTSIAYHVVMIFVLARYTFTQRKVMTEVILAATSLYLVLGSIFAAIYGLILWMDPGAFVSTNGVEMQWQQLLYYSYVTLTTLGYGDILPVTYYAQSFAALQAILGTLYSVLLLSRLVGLHAANGTP